MEFFIYNKNFLFIAILLILAATFNVNAENEYVPGEIIVEFTNNATEQQVKNVINSHYLQWKEGPFFVQISSLRAYIQIPKEIIDDFSLRDALVKEIINKDKEMYGKMSILVSSWPVSFTYIEKYGGIVLIVLFNNTATERNIRNLIDSFKDLGILDIVSENSSAATIHLWGVVKVPVGEEQLWITTLKKEPLVKSAGLNFKITQNAEPTTQSKDSSPVITTIPISQGTKQYAETDRSLITLIFVGLAVVGLVAFFSMRYQRQKN
ncbi:MAG: hypothetical protein AB1643_01275 [Patescibacteria group bacterium]